MPEQEVSVIAKLVDMITSPVKVVFESLESLLGVSKKVESEEMLTPALTGWSKILNALMFVFPGLEPILGGFIKTVDTVADVVDTTVGLTQDYSGAMDVLKGILPQVGDAGEELTEQMEEEDEAIRQVGEAAEEAGGDMSELGGEFGSLAGSAAAARAAVAALRAEIAAMKSKTIVITVVTRKVTVTVKGKTSASGGVGAGGSASTTVSLGSNPFGPNGGMGGMSSIEGKEFTEKVVLPSLKTLAREGKVDEVVH